MKSPLRVFFLATLICLSAAFLLQFFGKSLALQLLTSSRPISILYSKQFVIPRYYFETGQPDDAIQELNRQISSLTPADVPAAQEALNDLIVLRQSPIGQLAFMLLSVSSFWPLRLFIAAGVLAVMFLTFLAVSVLGKRPLFVIIPFIDHAGLNIGENLPLAVLDRLREVSWRMDNFQSVKGVIAEQLDIPSLGLVSDGDSIDAVALLETALLFSTGISDIPLSRFFNSLRMWAEQPRYLVRGSFEKVDEKIQVSLQIIDRQRNCVVQAWHHELLGEGKRYRNDIIDAVLYPLLFYFTKKIRTKRWESLHALHLGLEEFQSFGENQECPEHLKFAEQSMLRALQFDPTYSLAHYDLGLLYLTAGDYESAREHLMDASRLLQSEEEGLWATYHYGVALFQTAQEWAYQRAAKTFSALADDESCSMDLRSLAKSSLSATYAKLAKIIYKKKDEYAQKSIAEAEWVIENAKSLDAVGNAWAARGYAEISLGRYEESVFAFKHAIEQNPTNLNALIGLGESSFHLNKNDEALSVLRQAAMLSPLGGYVHYRIGNLYREMGDTKEAINSYKNAPKLAVAHLTLGKIYLDNDSLSDALDEFRAAAQINSRLSDAWNNVAWTILELDDESLYAEAENAARRSLQLERQESLLWHRHSILALVLLKRSKTALALKEAQSAATGAPEQAQAWYTLGSTQHQLGQLVDARKSLQKVLQLDKKGFWRAKAESLLKLFPSEN